MHINYHREEAPSKALEELEAVEDLKYLGTSLASSLPDFRQRSGIVWNNFWKSQNHLEICKLTLREKRRSFSGPYFPEFGPEKTLNSEKCPNFSRSVVFTPEA